MEHSSSQVGNVIEPPDDDGPNAGDWELAESFPAYYAYQRPGLIAEYRRKVYAEAFADGYAAAREAAARLAEDHQEHMDFVVDPDWQNHTDGEKRCTIARAIRDMHDCGKQPGECEATCS